MHCNLCIHHIFYYTLSRITQFINSNCVRYFIQNNMMQFPKVKHIHKKIWNEKKLFIPPQIRNFTEGFFAITYLINFNSRIYFPYKQAGAQVAHSATNET